MASLSTFEACQKHKSGIREKKCEKNRVKFCQFKINA